MDIILHTGEVITDVIPITKREDIVEGCKLYYELIVNYTQKTGRFKEIKDPIRYRDWASDLNTLENIKHNNYVIKLDEVNK
jgi:hypothetical protein